MPRIRMCDADRERYGGPEWVEISMADLLDESTGLLEQIEEAWGLTPGEFLVRSSRGSVKAARAMIWAARYRAGCKDDPRTFRPLTQEFSGVRYEPTGSELEAAVRAAREAEAGPPVNRADRRAAAKPKGKAIKSGKAAARSSTDASGT